MDLYHAKTNIVAAPIGARRLRVMAYLFVKAYVVPLAAETFVSFANRPSTLRLDQAADLPIACCCCHLGRLAR